MTQDINHSNTYNLQMGTLQQLQQTQLYILKKFIEVCTKLDVSWFVVYGTALGTVRHDGFIPWDDDIDVGMLRPDYERFMQEAQKHLPEELSIQAIRTDPDYNLLHAKIRHSGTTYLEAGWETNKGNQGVFIDIFPLDYIPEAPLAKWIFLKRIRFYQVLISIFTEKEAGKPLSKKGGIKGLVRQIASVVAPSFYSGAKSVALKLVAMLCKTKVTGCVKDCEVRSIEYRTDWFKETKKHQFEDIEVNLPCEYDAYLTTAYGDYMTPPPEDQRVPLHIQGIVDCEKPYTHYTNRT